MGWRLPVAYTRPEAPPPPGGVAEKDRLADRGRPRGTGESTARHQVHAGGEAEGQDSDHHPRRRERRAVQVARDLFPRYRPPRKLTLSPRAVAAEGARAGVPGDRVLRAGREGRAVR